ncbi:S-layer homology domain-containing protein [Kocuria sp. U4B]
MNLRRSVLAVATAAALVLGGAPAAPAAELPAPAASEPGTAPAGALSGGRSVGGVPADLPAELPGGRAAAAPEGSGGPGAAAAATPLPTTVQQITEVFDIVNDHRRQGNRAPLAYNTALSRNAQQWAESMAGARTPLYNPGPYTGAPAGALRMDQYYGKGEFTGTFAGPDAVEAITHYLLDFFPRNGTDQFARDLTHLGIGVASVPTTGPAGPGWETYVTIYFYAYPAGKHVPGTYARPADGFVPPYAPPRIPPFADVATGHVFYKEIAWLAERGISTGWVSATGVRTYRPAQPVARSQMAAFLYRMAGSPAYTPPRVSPFRDVPTGHVFYKEIAWLAERGISTGWVSATGVRTYRPAQPVARSQMAAFLYRAAGSPAYTPPRVSPFRDVRTGHVFYDEMAWLAERGISTGWVAGDGSVTYRPGLDVTRGVMAAFLYRADPLL